MRKEKAKRVKLVASRMHGKTIDKQYRIEALQMLGITVENAKDIGTEYDEIVVDDFASRCGYWVPIPKRWSGKRKKKARKQ